MKYLWKGEGEEERREWKVLSLKPEFFFSLYFLFSMSDR
jgi:hypothetical protein